MLISKVLRFAFAVVLLLATAVIGVSAAAFLRVSPGGDDGAGKYRDNSGHLGYRKGQASTWAECWGRINATDEANDKKAARGGIVDNKYHEGGIPEAVSPFWIWQVESKMIVKSQAHRVVSDLRATGRGVLAHWGDGGALSTTLQNPQPRTWSDLATMTSRSKLMAP